MNGRSRFWGNVGLREGWGKGLGLNVGWIRFYDVFGYFFIVNKVLLDILWGNMISLIF